MIEFFSKRNVRPFFSSASIYQREEKVFLNPNARTRDGIRTGMSLVLISEINNPVDIRYKLLEVLKACVDDVPDSYNGEPSPAVAALVKASGLRSWRSFHNATRQVSVFQDKQGQPIELTPMRKVGGGVEFISEKKRVVPLDFELLGMAVIQALAECE